MSLIPFDAIDDACAVYPEVAAYSDLFEDFVALTGGELTAEYKNALLLWLSQCPIKNHRLYVPGVNSAAHGGSRAAIH